jgi:16S rRNA processing protein RimM
VAGPSADTVVVGRISGLFGVHGWVRIFDYCRQRGDILGYDTWLLRQGNEWNEVRVIAGRLQANTVVVQLEGCIDREAARTLIGSEISIRSDQLESPADGEFYWQDLKGLTVLNMAGETLGVVADLLETGANDVLVVKGESELLIPYTTVTVDQVDLKDRHIRVHWERDY